MAHQLLSRRFGIAHKRSPDASLYLTHQPEHGTPTQQAAAGPVRRSASRQRGQLTPTRQRSSLAGEIAGDLIADIRDLDRRIAAVNKRIKVAVVQAQTSLVELFGVGPVLAATFPGEVGDIGSVGSYG